MPNLLRKFRRQNMKGKYLKYAIGEIILVVVGILIALGINNWNENRKKDQRAEETLEILISEINNNLIEVTRIYSLNQQILDSVDEYLKSQSNYNSEIEKATFVTNSLNYHWTRLDHPTLVQEIGPNKVMKSNPLVIGLLKELKSTYEDAALQITYLDSYFNNQTLPFLLKNNAGRSLLNSIYQTQASNSALVTLFQTAPFDNILSVQFVLLRGVNQKLYELKTKSETTLISLNP